MSPSPKDTTPLDSLPVGRLGIIPLKSWFCSWRKGQRLHCRLA